MDFKSNTDGGPRPFNIQLTKVVDPHDTIAKSFGEAIKKEKKLKG